eukprot:TRINITY_DN39044_c0_g1_i3.p1 TRINITY_DN39044_c0_g1~~TRINITY_DN39044_c0_g1_i3.p1  ORF type:complete len:218 (-),score=39.01 TRINITY_DN39044_c0_g1_i3:25-654(-)
MPDDLNLQLSQRVSVALAFVSVGFALVLTVYWGGYFLTPIFALLLFMMSRFWLEGHETPGKRAILGITIGFALLVGLAWNSQMLDIIPPVLLGYILLFLRHRYTHIHDRRAQLASWGLILYGVLSSLFLLTYLPGHIMLGLFLTTLLAMVVLNNQFYLFLAAKRGRAFAISAIPFHLLYHSYNGISFGVGFLRHHWNNLFRHAPRALEK